MAIGYTGVTTIFLKFISPVTIAPVIAAIGLGLYDVAFPGIADCWSLGLMQLCTVVVFSQ
jgi:xanthine/uracil permease